MFASPGEALLRAPPLPASSIVEAAAHQPRSVLHTAFDESMVFAALPSETWCDDAIFLSGQRRLASENRHGRWMAVDRRIAVSLRRSPTADTAFLPWSVLPAVAGVVQCVSMEQRGATTNDSNKSGASFYVDDARDSAGAVIVLAVGTTTGIDLILLTADDDAAAAAPSSSVGMGGFLTVRDVQHVRGSLSVRLVEFRDPETLLYVTVKGAVGTVAFDVQRRRGGGGGSGGAVLTVQDQLSESPSSAASWGALYQHVSSSFGRGETVAALWSGLTGAAGGAGGSTFVSATYDRARRLCLVLTTTALELWNVAASTDRRRLVKLGTMRVHNAAAAVVSVHASHPDDAFLAVLLFDNGLRQHIQSTSLSNGSVELVVKHEETRKHALLGSVAQSASYGSTSVVYDATLRMLVMDASGVTLLPDSDGTACDVVTSLQLTDDVIGITALPLDDGDASPWDAKIVVYGPRGPLTTIVRRPLHQVLSARIARAGISVVHLAVGALGGEATARLLLEAYPDAPTPSSSHHLQGRGAYQPGSNDDVLDPIVLADSRLIESCLAALMAPVILQGTDSIGNSSNGQHSPANTSSIGSSGGSNKGSAVQFSPVVAAIRRIVVETIHSVEFTMKRRQGSIDAHYGEFVEALEHHVSSIQSTIRKVERSLRPGGWLDTTHAAAALRNVQWRDLCVAQRGDETHHHPFTPATAASAQAVFLKELHNGLSFLETLCQLLCVGMRAGVSDVAVECRSLASAVWIDTTRQQELTRIGIQCVLQAPPTSLSSSSLWCLQAIDGLVALPPIVRALAQIKLQPDLPHAVRVVRAHMQLLADEERIDDVVTVLSQGATSASDAVEAHVLAAWLPLDKTGEAVRRVLALLDAAPDAKRLAAMEGLAEALPPRQLIDWIVGHRITQATAHRAVLVQWLSSAMSRHPGATHHITATPSGLFLYACVLLGASASSLPHTSGSGASRRAARQLLLELARDPNHAIDLAERLEVLRTARQVHTTTTTSVKPDHEVHHLLALGQLQQTLLDGLSAAIDHMEAAQHPNNHMLLHQNADAARACIRLLTSQLLSEDDLCHAAQQWSGVMDCAATVQLGVLLLHDDVVPHLDSIAATLEVILYQVQHQSEAPHRTPLDAACLVSTTYGSAIPEAFPMARCLLSYLMRVDATEYEGIDACCRRLLETCPQLDPVAMFMAVGEYLTFVQPGQDEAMQERLRFDHVLVALIEVLRCPRMSADDRAQCLEMLQAHVASVCSSIASQESFDDLGDVAHVVAALQSLEKSIPSTSFWVSHTSSILRGFL